MSGLEIARWLRSNSLQGVRVGKIYRYNDIFIFEVHGAPKKFLILRPGGIYLANYAPKGKADAFCMLLRKIFSGRKIQRAEQIKSDRIVRLVFDDRDLIAELFGKGNLIVVDKEGVIEHALVQRKWSSREIKKGIKYVPPPSFDWIHMPKEKVIEAVEGKDKAEVAKLLGIGKKVEEIWGSADEIVKKLFEELEKPISNDEIERRFFEEDKKKLVEREKEKREGKIKAMEKSIEELKKKIEEYESKARMLREAASYIFQNLAEIDSLLENARKRGEKKIKVSIPIDKRGAP